MIVAIPEEFDPLAFQEQHEDHIYHTSVFPAFHLDQQFHQPLGIYDYYAAEKSAHSSSSKGKEQADNDSNSNQPKHSLVGKEPISIPEKGVAVTSLRYIPERDLLAVGFNFSCYQLWNVSLMTVAYCSPPLRGIHLIFIVVFMNM